MASSVRWLLQLGSSIVAALLVGGVMQLLHEPSSLVHALVCSFVFVLTLCSFYRPRKKINRTALLLTLDRENAAVQPAPYAMRADDTACAAWQAALQRCRAGITRWEWQRLRHVGGRLLLLLLLFVAVMWGGALTWPRVLPAYHHILALLQTEARLTVLPAGERQFQLRADDAPQIALSKHELALIEIAAPQLKQNPLMQLRVKDEVWQEIQLQPQQPGRYAVTLSIDRSSTLHIDTVDANAALAYIEVKAGQTPKLTLEAQTAIKDPHPDNEALTLLITASATTPLANVKLLITTQSGTFEELVNTIVAKQKQQLVTTYRVFPEAYMESDFAEIELVATATDRNGETGHSAPLLLNAISAWGRYQRVLEKLKEAKTLLDEKVTQPASSIEMAQIRATLRAAVADAHASPFFDAIDRLALEDFVASSGELRQSKDKLAVLLEKLNAFLFEHEILDDRERDRDFFTAVRHLSWIIANRNNKTAKYVQRFDEFLAARRQRWRLRVEALPPAQRPPRWEATRDAEPFRKGIAELAELPPAEAQERLTALAGSYRAWLEELEAQEDTHHRQLAQQAQQVISSARNLLQEMQQRQTRISTYLDKAMQRETEELQRGWPATRMQQKTNIKDAAPLLERLQTVSPLAVARLRSAVRAMRAAVTRGDAQQFAAAESHADLAGRLLRHARSATRNRLPMRRQRRRAVSGDRYHGQPIIGGYIELRHDYRVNEKYREDILEEIRGSNLLEKHRNLLDAYLRRVIR